MTSSRMSEICSFCVGDSLRKSSNSVMPTPERLSAGTSSSDNSSGSQQGSAGKQSRWQSLRRQRISVGLIPVDRNHTHFKLLSCVREGLKHVLLHPQDIGVKSVLTAPDFNSVTGAHLNFEGQEFEFESYAGSVFASLRHSLGIEEQQFLEAVIHGSLPYIEFKSNSKSGQDFFFSHDLQFIFKSNRKRDVAFLMSILPKYLQHFIDFPHSLLVKYVGCFSIKLKGKSKKFLLAMQSIFYPADRIEDRFDIKGCMAGRYQEPLDPKICIISVLKDQNFRQEELDLGDQSEWFVKQITEDSKFLSALNCMDYSLLIGRQKRHADERTETIFSILNRTGKSISPARKKQTNSLILDEFNGYKNNNRLKSDSLKDMSSENSDDHQEAPSHLSHDTKTSHSFPALITLPEIKPGIMFPRNLAEGVHNFQKEHRRLLPHCQNGLHIIDGQEYRYFLGIVDFLTLFDWRQKAAQYWKMVKYECGDHSTKSPDVYHRRFVSFLSERVR